MGINVFERNPEAGTSMRQKESQPLQSDIRIGGKGLDDEGDNEDGSQIERFLGAILLHGGKQRSFFGSM